MPLVDLQTDAPVRTRPALEVLRIFLFLGLTSFGGPVAHLGYVRRAFVERRRWLSERAFADLVALCQILPGPASSQCGFAIGLMRAGLAGGLAAWVGFTLPSAALLIAFAAWTRSHAGTGLGAGLVHGLNLVAVAVVGQALWAMTRTLVPDWERRAIATLAASVTALFALQIAAIAAGACLGLLLCRSGADLVAEPVHARVRHQTAAVAGTLFAVLLVAALVPWPDGPMALFSAFFRSGALVFGGGHVVLPLLNQALVVPGWVAEPTFMAGYGAAQAVPGPLFTVAAFLGDTALPSHPLAGAAVGLSAIFLPGLLLVVAALPYWHRVRSWPGAAAALRGTNAAVVGVLAWAFYDPVCTSALQRPADVALAIVGLLLLVVGRVPPLVVVVLLTAASFVASGA